MNYFTNFIRIRTGLIYLIIFLILTSTFNIYYSKASDAHQYEKTDGNSTSSSENGLFFRWRPRQFKIRYDMIVRNEGNNTVNITTYLLKPKQLINQELVDSIIYDPLPNGFVTDRWNQTAAWYEYSLESSQNKTFTWLADALVYTVRYIILPWRYSLVV